MLEMIVNPKSSTEKPWKMFFVGFIFASVSILLVWWAFLKDPVKYANEFHRVKDGEVKKLKW